MQTESIGALGASTKATESETDAHSHSSDFVVTYLVETADDPANLADKIARDQSTGTFVSLPGETRELRARVGARVVEIRELVPTDTPSLPELDPKSKRTYRRIEADIAYPFESIGYDLSTLMTTAIGGVYSIRGLSGVRVTRLKMSDECRGRYLGPQFGIEGTRRLTSVSGRPIIGTIVKPSVGLRPLETALVVKSLVEAGVDFIKDDEKLTSPPYSNVRERVRAIMPIVRDYEQRTGKKVMYAFGLSNVDLDQMLHDHDWVAREGGNAAVVNINSIGLAGVAYLRKRSPLVLHAHRNGWDILTRHPGLGMDFGVYQQFWRLVGIDQFQINGIGAKYWEPDASFVQSFHDLASPIFDASDCALPVVCSGQWGGQAPETYARTGRTVDLMYLCGGGVISHPDGPAGGVRAVRQAWEAAVSDIPLATYAESHSELKKSLQKFGAGAGNA